MIAFRPRAQKRSNGERGVTIVEAAFALPILLMFMFGLVDVGMWVFNSNQATNAARDGARLGIIDFETADDIGSEMHTAIVAAVESRLDRHVSADQVTVRCVTPGGTSTDCEYADVDADRIQVDVEWHWDFVTPIAAVFGQDRGSASGSATMVLSGRPLSPPASAGGGSTDPATETDCVATVDPISSVSRKNNSHQLQNAVAVKFTTTGTCNDLRIELQSPTGDVVPQVVCGCDPTPKEEGHHEYSYKGSDNIWTVSGSALVSVYDGTTVVGSAPFTVL